MKKQHPSHRKTLITLLWPLLVSTGIGCRPLDWTQGHVGPGPLCPIHACEMRPERIVVGGEGVYVLQYLKEARASFPNHGSHRLNHERESTPYERDVIDWVCPECHRLYLQYWKDHSKAVD